MSRVGIGAVLLGLSFGYAAGVVGPAAAPVSRDFGVSLSAAGLMTSIFFIAIAVFALVATPVEERLGVPWSARLGAVLLGIGCALSAVSPWFALMLVGRGLAGLGTGLVFIAAPVIIRALRSAVLLGSYGGGITFGLAASLFIGGVLAENGVDWRVNFLIAAAIGFSSLVFLFGRMPEIARMRRVGGGGVGRLLLEWPFWRADSLFIFVNGVPVVVGAWLIHYLTIHHWLGVGVAGAFGFLLFGVTTIARPFGGRLSNVASLRVVLATVGPALAAAGLATLAIDRTASVAAVAIVVTALGFGAPYAIAYERVEDLVEGNPELGLAVAVQGVNVVAIVVVPLIGAALEHGYGRYAFLGLAAYCVLAGLANLTRGAD
jgi:MFS family permease